jgi:hypothetical protein
MTFRDVLRAAAIAAVLLIVLAAAGLAALRASVSSADHAAIRAALIAADPSDLGLPKLIGRRDGFRVNHYSECVGLSILLREARWLDMAEIDPVIPAIRGDAILPDGTGTMCLRLKDALTDEDAVTWFTYARYWHGALMLHRAVLSVTDYGTLKDVAIWLLALSGLMLALALTWRFGPAAALAVVVPAAVLSDARAIVDLPLQAMCLTAFVAAAAAFVAFGAGRRGWGALVAAAVTGGALNFFDFLYNPSSFAMLCAWGWLAAGWVRGERRSLGAALLVFGAAIGGYGGMWALKWIAAFAADPSGTQIFVFGVGEFTRWGPVAPVLAATATVWTAAFDAGWKIAVGAGLAGVTLVLALARAKAAASGWIMVALRLMAPIVPAYLVIELMSGHTTAHPEFTFRIVPWTIAVVLASVVVALRYTTPAARNALTSSAL